MQKVVFCFCEINLKIIYLKKMGQPISFQNFFLTNKIILRKTLKIINSNDPNEELIYRPHNYRNTFDSNSLPPCDPYYVDKYIDVPKTIIFPH